MKDGKILVAIEKERITRKKHDGGNDKDAVAYCLDAAGISVYDLDLVVQCANFEKDTIGLTHYHGERLFPADLDIPVVSISHHLAHAYSALGTAPFSDGHVFVLDGCGSPYDQCDDLRGAQILAPEELHAGGLYCEKDSFYHYSDNSLTPLVKDFSVIMKSEQEGIRLPTTLHSIGGLYSAISSYCFGNMDDAGKLMGLSPFGKKGVYDTPVFRLADGRVMVNDEWLRQLKDPAGSYEKFRQQFSYYADIACHVQQQVEEAILYVIRHRIQQSGARRLCYSGGVALNALANKRILEETGLEALHIEPAAGDNGLALGCVYYGWMHVLKQEKVQHNGSTSFGKMYDDRQMDAALTLYQDRITVRTKENIADETAELLAQGNVIGWFQGGSEFGPRALGHRSILADPRKPGVKDYINLEIKHREDFRPFAPSVLKEEVHAFYTGTDESPYMLLVNEVKPGFREMLRSVVHENLTSRIQTVTPGWNGIYYDLIKAFATRTGLPMLLNTSFNKRGMPIVETPQDAIDFFVNSKLDHLVVHNRIISRVK
jgi:carbamoyltransferase